MGVRQSRVQGLLLAPGNVPSLGVREDSIFLPVCPGLWLSWGAGMAWELCLPKSSSSSLPQSARLSPLKAGSHRQVDTQGLGQQWLSLHPRRLHPCPASQKPRGLSSKGLCHGVVLFSCLSHENLDRVFDMYLIMFPHSTLFSPQMRWTDWKPGHQPFREAHTLHSLARIVIKTSILLWTFQMVHGI